MYTPGIDYNAFTRMPVATIVAVLEGMLIDARRTHRDFLTAVLNEHNADAHERALFISHLSDRASELANIVTSRATEKTEDCTARAEEIAERISALYESASATVAAIR